MSHSNPNQFGLDQSFSGFQNLASMLNEYNRNQAVQKADDSSGQPHYQQQHQPVTTNVQAASGTNRPALFSDLQAASAQPQQAMAQHAPGATYTQRPQQLTSHVASPDDSSPNATQALPTGWQNDEFWSRTAALVLRDGQRLKGTFAQLYRFPDAHKSIWHHYYEYARNQAAAQAVAQPQSQPPVAEHQMTRVTDAAKALSDVLSRSKAPKRKSRAKGASGLMRQVPSYTPDPDLDTPQKCREYLAYIDPAEVSRLRFQNDDWRDVLENRKHEFIAGIFEALTHPHSQQPPHGITLSKQAREKYNKQQSTQLTKVVAQLQTQSQLKAAKAMCSLLFHAAVYVHEVGVPKDVFQGYQWYVTKGRQVDRKFRLDLDAICSTRLEKIIDGIKANKLIAMDVLEQTNFHRMARDPEFYLLEKFTYLRSNKTRQENIDRHNREDEERARFEEVMFQATTPAPTKSRKRKQRTVHHSEDEMEFEDEVNSDEDFDEFDDDGDEFEQAFKRLRR